MALNITVAPRTIEEVTTPAKSGPGIRTLRMQELDDAVLDILKAVKTEGAAVIDFKPDDSEYTANQFVHGLRSALARAEQNDLLVRKVRGSTEVRVWPIRPEDEAVLEKRRETGARLGEYTRQRAHPAPAAAPVAMPQSSSRARAQTAGAPRESRRVRAS